MDFLLQTARFNIFLISIPSLIANGITEGTCKLCLYENSHSDFQQNSRQ